MEHAPFITTLELWQEQLSLSCFLHFSQPVNSPLGSCVGVCPSYFHSSYLMSGLLLVWFPGPSLACHIHCLLRRLPQVSFLVVFPITMPGYSQHDGLSMPVRCLEDTVSGRDLPSCPSFSLELTLLYSWSTLLPPQQSTHFCHSTLATRILFPFHASFIFTFRTRQASLKQDHQLSLLRSSQE